jgi:hypothetical protein
MRQILAQHAAGHDEIAGGRKVVERFDGAGPELFRALPERRPIKGSS